MVFFSIFFILSTVVLAAPHPSLQNITVTVPEGTSDHGDSRLLCTPTKAFDVFSFFVANYFTHAFSVVPMPGEVFLTSILSMANALFYPVSGVHRGVEAMRRMAICQHWKQRGVAHVLRLYNHVTGKQQEKQPNDPLNANLEIALRAGALCEVIRTHGWKPNAGETCYVKIQSAKTKETCNLNIPQSTEPKEPENSTAKWEFLSRPDGFVPARGFWRGGRKVHGCCHLPKEEGYALAILPEHAKVQPRSNTRHDEQIKHKDCLTLPSYSHSPLRILVAIIQLYFSISTLVSTRGDQISRYGYAAFGLTVVPYLLVSTVNLIGSLVTPTFDRVYLIETPIMEEARSRGCHFDHIVGELVKHEPPPTSGRIPPTPAQKLWKFYSHFFLETIPMGYTALARSIVHDQIFFFHDRNPSLRDPKFLSKYLMSSLRGLKSDLRSSRDRIFSLFNPDTILFNPETPSNPPTKEHQPFTWPVDTKSAAETSEDTDFTVLVPFSAVVTKEVQRYSDLAKLLIEYCCMLIGCLSLAVIGGYSYFEARGSSEAQCGWTMAWLAMGILFGSVAFGITLEFSNGLVTSEAVFKCFLFCMAYSVPAIGGMVIVGQMIWDYGSCSRLY